MCVVERSVSECARVSYIFIDTLFERISSFRVSSARRGVCCFPLGHSGGSVAAFRKQK